MGKGDALSYFYEKLEAEGVALLTASFPVYATPVGNTIRELLISGGESFGLSPQEDLEVKMSLFALNRLEFLQAYLSQDIWKETLILFDRSAFSNALTIAYGIKDFEGITREEIASLVLKALELDSLFIEKLNLKNCVIQLDTGEEDWHSERGRGTDLHEVPDVQRLALDVYSFYREFVGEGWKVILTKEFDEKEGRRVWRDREDIFSDIFAFLAEKFGDFKFTEGKGKRGEIGIKEIMNVVYPGSRVDNNLLNQYSKSIRSNDKESMYALSVQIKKQICASYKGILFEDKEVRVAFKAILDRYPKIEYVLESSLGKEYILRLQEALRDE